MARRMDHRQDLIAYRDFGVRRERLPADSPRSIQAGPPEFLQADAWMRGEQRGRAARMIRVSVGHEHSLELRRVALQLRLERGKVARIADTGVNENSPAIGTDEEVGVVAGARHRAGIV